MVKPRIVRKDANTARPPPSERGLLTYSVPQAGALLGLSRNGSYEAAARGEIPTIRIGSRIMVPRAAFHQMLEAASADWRRQPNTTVSES
jgi:excisionase family DNA binding protein